MRGITIFARPGFLGNHFHNLIEADTILRLSGEVRGREIANYIGAKFNPTEGFENDLCIFVKGFKIKLAKPGDYVDISDENLDVLLPFLNERQDVHAIAHSQYAFEYLQDKIKNKLVLIPQQHLNWENATKEKHDPLVGGYIGRISPISLEIQNEIRDTLNSIGHKFNIGFEWHCREDAIAHYKNMDVLIIGGYGKLPQDTWQITPTKMINAASFGIPSMSFMRVGYKEFEGYYTQIETMEDIKREMERLRDPVYYAEYSARIKAKADEYHISKIGAKYLALCQN